MAPLQKVLIISKKVSHLGWLFLYCNRFLNVTICRLFGSIILQRFSYCHFFLNCLSPPSWWFGFALIRSSSFHYRGLSYEPPNLNPAERREATLARISPSRGGQFQWTALLVIVDTNAISNYSVRIVLLPISIFGLELINH